MDLIRDCLDKQLVDSDGNPMGRVDGIVMEWSQNQQPKISYIEVGAVTQWRRVHRSMGRLATAIQRKLGVTTNDPYRIPWTKVVVTGNEVVAAVNAEKSPARAWERWFRSKIIMKIPGA